MNTQSNFDHSTSDFRSALWSFGILVCGFVLGAGLFSFGGTPQTFLRILASAGALGVLLLYPELALALYVVIGDIKGDARVAAILPVDLTLALGATLVTGIALNCLRRKRSVSMPGAYFLFLVLLVLMAASLFYTPIFSAGLEKFGRFLTVTGIVIVAPFFVLGTPAAMKRFLVGFSVAAFAICSWSLSELGGSDRLATPSDNTIGLGHIACALILLIWFAAIPWYSFPKKLLAYALLAVPALALIGSGSRGPAIACGTVIAISLFFNPKRLFDIGWVSAMGFLALPFANIPGSSLQYLGTLIRSNSVGDLLSFRGDLLSHGWQLLQQHPLFGVGIEGFRYYSPNPELYKWPHNIFLEIACELGIPAALITFALFGAAIREAWLQLRDRASPLFMLSQLAAALLAIGIINSTNTGDINSDRSTWLFISLVFVVRGLRLESPPRSEICADSICPVPA